MTAGKDDTPDWAYDEDGYCVCCGYGRWRYHGTECELRDALDAVGKGDPNITPGDHPDWVYDAARRALRDLRAALNTMTFPDLQGDTP